MPIRDTEETVVRFLRDNGAYHKGVVERVELSFAQILIDQEIAEPTGARADRAVRILDRWMRNLPSPWKSNLASRPLTDDECEIVVRFLRDTGPVHAAAWFAGFAARIGGSIADFVRLDVSSRRFDLHSTGVMLVERAKQEGWDVVGEIRGAASPPEGSGREALPAPNEHLVPAVTGRILVRFVTNPPRGFSVGDAVEWPSDEAREWIRSGIAVEADPETQALIGEAERHMGRPLATRENTPGDAYRVVKRLRHDQNRPLPEVRSMLRLWASGSDGVPVTDVVQQPWKYLPHILGEQQVQELPQAASVPAAEPPPARTTRPVVSEPLDQHMTPTAASPARNCDLKETAGERTRSKWDTAWVRFLRDHGDHRSGEHFEVAQSTALSWEVGGIARIVAIPGKLPPPDTSWVVFLRAHETWRSHDVVEVLQSKAESLVAGGVANIAARPVRDVPDVSPQPVVVRLSECYKNLFPGEIAGFPPDEAQQLIDWRIAVLYGDGKPIVAESASPRASASPDASESSVRIELADDPTPAEARAIAALAAFVCSDTELTAIWQQTAPIGQSSRAALAMIREDGVELTARSLVAARGTAGTVTAAPSGGDFATWMITRSDIAMAKAPTLKAAFDALAWSEFDAALTDARLTKPAITATEEMTHKPIAPGKARPTEPNPVDWIRGTKEVELEFADCWVKTYPAKPAIKRTANMIKRYAQDSGSRYHAGDGNRMELLLWRGDLPGIVVWCHEHGRHAK